MCSAARGLIAASPYAVADRFTDGPVRNRQQHEVSSTAAHLADHIGEVPVLMIPCVEVIDGDGILTATPQPFSRSTTPPRLSTVPRGFHSTTWSVMTDGAPEQIQVPATHLKAPQGI
jgi:hypothetical protein